MSVKLYWMVCHCQVTDANSDTFVQSSHQGVKARKNTTVPSPEIELEHRVYLRHGSSWFNVVGTKEKTIISIHFFNPRMWLSRMSYPKSHHSHCHLRHFIGMRVVHEGARSLGFKLVQKSFSWWDTFLVQTNHTIHSIG